MSNFNSSNNQKLTASALFILIFASSSLKCIICKDETILPPVIEQMETSPLEKGAEIEARVSQSGDTLSASSHRIVASGWPSTSPMWPSIETASGESANASHWLSMVEPFIYADKPRSVDYSLLLAINSTTSDLLKSRVKPMGVNLAFEYYFNHEQKITALPGIKIEVDRKQFKYLEPNKREVQTKMWIKFNEQITITDPSQFDNHDWLKFSLVNRQSPSLVAIRRLKVEFLMNAQAQEVSTETTTASSLPASSTVAPTTASATSPAPRAQTQGEEQSKAGEAFGSSSTGPEIATRPTNSVPNDVPQQTGDTFQPADAGGYQDQGEIQGDSVPAASHINHIISHKIEPVEAKNKGSWLPGWGKRRKRQSEAASNGTNSDSIVLTCYRSDQCDWVADSSDSIQWSLARQPPSTNTVQSGYYYNSNRNNYGDASKMLRLTLNQTDSATIADQNSDHCIELALYVTEKTHLKLFRLTKSPSADKNDLSESSWIRGNLLLIWAPTITSENEKANAEQSTKKKRSALPKSILPAMENGKNGWTVETLCYGDFFADYKNCGSGKCAFGFEMEPDTQRAGQAHGSPASELLASERGQVEVDQSTDDQQRLSLASASFAAEQVVGVALLREYSLNIPVKPSRSKWFETWQRDEVEPSDNWKFYPNLDYKVDSNNISLINLFDDAHYYIESEWLDVGYNLNFTATLVIDMSSTSNQTLVNDTNTNSTPATDAAQEDSSVFSLRMISKLVDSNFIPIYSNKSIIYWSPYSNDSTLDLGIPVSERILEERGNRLTKNDIESDDKLFKIILEFVLDCHWLNADQGLEKFLADRSIVYGFTLANVSLSDRCFPNPCEFGSCQQNGTGFEDWNCQCDDKHRGRQCQFGKWCNLAHVTPWNSQGTNKNSPVTLRSSSKQPKVVSESITRVSGKEFCQKKLGNGFKCTDVDLPLNDNLYTDEGVTFDCSCQDDHFLSDDSKCKQAHLCNAVICPAIGMICDESKPFNKTQPCQCNEKQDWFPDAKNPTDKCIRQQCRDKKRDCQFDAHICLPTLPGERPICKCGPKFTMKTDERGQNYCQSTACILPTLNDCQQICIPDNSNLERPYTCSCHPGYLLDGDGQSCRPQKLNSPPHCRPNCHSRNQICTDEGCKCKQGYLAEGEVIVQQTAKNRHPNGTVQHIDYVQSVRCLNVCSLTYAENKAEFERIESVCPFGLCDADDFSCRCSDPMSSALVNTKYEPIYNTSLLAEDPNEKQRISPLCHLKRVCEVGSNSYKICKSQGAICVPDYTKAAMFDCVCPPSTEKKYYGQGTSSEFSCEPRCSAKRYDCLRRQAICKLVDKDQVRCECLPGLMFDQRDQKCYLAKYSYSFNLIVVNKYYEPESKFHKIEFYKNSTQDNSFNSVKNSRLYDRVADSDELIPQFQQSQDVEPDIKRELVARSIFITDYNQCNITQVIPKAVIEDPYEHDMESFLGYIDQCNEKIHQNVRNYHLNSRLSEDLRQALRQHLRDFTVTTNNSSCVEIDSSGMYLNCTVYLQSNDPIPKQTIDYVFNECDKHGQNDNYCWIKPRLLLKKPTSRNNNSAGSRSPSNDTQLVRSEFNFHQIIPCDVENFCGQDAFSVRSDEKTSLCSCKCPPDIEVVDIRDLEPRREDEEPAKFAVKEVCAPRNHCGPNSTFCLAKTGSVCHYDIRLGSKCNCVYPSYESADGRCVEVAFSHLDNTFIVIIIMLGTGLLVSIAINLAALARSKNIFGRSKQYPLSEFPVTRPQTGRSTGIPNPTFTND